MLIGVDFDNTIVCYDAVFHRMALERGLIPADLAVNKTAVRDHLRSIGREETWTEMQGEVYGARMAEAVPYPGVREFFARCHSRGIPVVIISHKTRHPYRGQQHDLHATAREWLRHQGLVDCDREGTVHFELTKAEKLARIGRAGCTHFVDDLPELLADPAFPSSVERFLFAPAGAAQAEPDIRVFPTWADLTTELFAEAAWQAAVDAVLARRGFQGSGPYRRIGGGANNRVYRLTTEPAADILVKRYFLHPHDPRDRFATEQAFYRYAAHADAAQVPRALGWDEGQRIGVFAYIHGERPAAASPALISAALDFVRRLNVCRNDPLAPDLPPASEACFSIEAHLQTVTRRVAALRTAVAGSQSEPEIGRMVNQLVRPAADAVDAEIRQRLNPAELATELPRAQRCVSPSDFGFHNSLIDLDGRVRFFDFEYAGWDDPAKLVCDFFCQPEVPVPAEAFNRFGREIARALGLPAEAFAARCRMLLPVYRVKWSCILLNEFTPVGQQRRVFSLGSHALADRRARQLGRVRTLLADSPLAA